MIRRYFKRLWCARIHKRWWEIDGFDTSRCRKCGEIHNPG